MLIADFDDTPREAFVRGFWKGLGAPYLLYGEFDMPPLPEIQAVDLPLTDAQAAIAQDWRKVGQDIRAAVDAYAKKPNQGP